MNKYPYYEREIHYYETDRMGVVHHSNYARFLEECRIDMMGYYGLSYAKLEEMGYMIPVLELSERFIESVKFGDTIRIVPEIYKISSYKFYMSYRIYDADMQTLKHTAETVHCFLNMEFKPVSLKKEAPEMYNIVLGMAPDAN